MSTLTAWLLTYLLHSTVLLGGAWLLRVALRERRLGLQEAAVRAALVGGFLTASLQLGLGLQPLGGVVTMPEEPAPRPVEAVVVVFDAGAPASGTGVTAVGKDVRTERRAASGWRIPSSTVWQPILGGVWALVALMAVARLGVAAGRLRRLLRTRRPLPATDLLAKAATLAARLGLRRPVPMSAAPRLEVPLATGVFRPEVCLPTRALRELAGDQQVALCAHELAHVARRDPAWILLARLAEAVAPLQPLNTWGRRRLQELAECLADDLAVAASGRPEGLARSLVDVASWTVADAVPFPAAAAGAVSTRSRLGHRVERLMDPVRALERPRRLLLPFAVVAVLATALVTPVVSGSVVAQAEPTEARTAPTPPEPTVTPEAPEAPEAPAAPEPPEAPEAPEAPDAPDAPDAPEAPASDAERELEELTQRIEERAEEHSAALEKIGVEIERVVEAHMPPPEEMKRLEGEIEEAAETLAKVHLARRKGSKAPTEDELAQARAQLEAAQEQMQEATSALRVPEGELRSLQEKARELAKAVAPTAEETRRLQELTRHLVEESMPDFEELKKEMEGISDTVGRETTEQIRESLRAVRESLRESMPRVREEARVAREAVRAAQEQQREAMRAAREASRAAARSAARAESEQARESRRQSKRAGETAGKSDRTLEEAEASHLEESAESTPE